MMNSFGLSSIHVQGQLLHNRAKVQLLQMYRNQSSKNLEFNYMFPVPHDAQICCFTMKIGARVIRSEIMETEEAYKEYDDSIMKGDSAAIVEAVGKDILELSAGNIAPRETVTIELQYLQELPWEDEGQSLRWQIPTVIAPRYTSDPGPEDYRKQPYIAPNDTKLQMDLDLCMLRPIQQISSPSHPISVSMKQAATSHDSLATKDLYQAHIALATTKEVPDSDIILTIALQDSSMPENALILTSPDQKFSLIQMHPSIAFEPSEDKERLYAFILDHSGSMGQEKMEQAKLALKLCLRQLSENDRFMLVAFNEKFDFLSHRPIPFHEMNLKRADDWIDAIYASGGTEIYKPLEYILQKMHSKHDNIVLLFTDGQVIDEDNIIKMVKDHADDLQLYPFGIDTAVNKAFLDGLAAVGNGLPEYIYPGEMIDDKVLRQFGRIHSPHYANGKILDEAGTEVEVFPLVPRRLFSGEFYQFLHKHPEEKPLGTLHFQCLQNGKETTIPIVSPPLDTVQGLERLSAWWALEKIRLLESLLPTRGQTRSSRLEKEIVELSVQYNVLSTFTSLVAVMPREEKVEGMPTFVKIPVSAPRGWDMDTPCEGAPRYDLGNAGVDGFSAPMSVMRNRKSGASLEDYCEFMKSPVHTASHSHQLLEPFAQQDASSIDPLEMAIRNAVLLQNANGSVGPGSDRTRATAMFVLGMVESGRAIKKYRMSLQKALQWLLDNAKSNGLIVSCALYLGTTRLTFSSDDIADTLKECQSQMSEAEKTVYKEFITGTFVSLWHTLFPSHDWDENNPDEIALRLLEEVDRCDQ
jgi:Ca-activated chloride channel family protein